MSAVISAVCGCGSGSACVGSSVVTFLYTLLSFLSLLFSSKTLPLNVLHFHQTGPSLPHRACALTSCRPNSPTFVPILAPILLLASPMEEISCIPSLGSLAYSPTLPSRRPPLHPALPALYSPFSFPWKHIRVAPPPHLPLAPAASPQQAPC